MIEVTLSQLVLIFCAIPILVLFVFWMLLKDRHLKNFVNINKKLQRLVETCPYCGAEVFDTKQEDLLKCKRCENYFKRKQS